MRRLYRLTDGCLDELLTKGELTFTVTVDGEEEVITIAHNPEAQGRLVLYDTDVRE